MLLGGAGSDTAAYSGDAADYGLIFLPGTDMRVVDLRAGSPDDTDALARSRPCGSRTARCRSSSATRSGDDSFTAPTGTRSHQRARRQRHDHVRLPPGRCDRHVFRQQRDRSTARRATPCSPGSRSSCSPTARSTTMTATAWSTTCSTIRAITTSGTRMPTPTSTTMASAGTKGAIRTRSSRPRSIWRPIRTWAPRASIRSRISIRSAGTEGRVPSLAFDPAQYLAAYPDVAAAHVDPLAHFLAFGAAGRPRSRSRRAS